MHAIKAETTAYETDSLALLYQGLLTSIVRVRSGAQPITNPGDFRKSVREMLSGIEREAIRAGYADADVRNTNYAIIAFLDEAVQGSNDPSRPTWSALQSEMYGDAVAGESFFDQLNALLKRRDSRQLADILEVYCLCLLLGYQGRYGGAGEKSQELRQIIAEVKARIDVVRGEQLPIAPEAAPRTAFAAPTAVPMKSNARLRMAAVLSLAALIVIWVVCRLVLSSQADHIQSSLVP